MCQQLVGSLPRETRSRSVQVLLLVYYSLYHHDSGAVTAIGVCVFNH